MNAERLLKMAEFLETLPPHKFDFKGYVLVGEKPPAEALAAPEEHCGTTACAVGWMPAVFPDQYEWAQGDVGNTIPMPKVRKYSWHNIQYEAMSFLDLNEVEYDFLFIPKQSPLNGSATAIQVATQIRQFVTTDGENMRQWEGL